MLSTRRHAPRNSSRPHIRLFVQPSPTGTARTFSTLAGVARYTHYRVPRPAAPYHHSPTPTRGLSATEGLISQFPVALDDRTAIVLASVLATKGDWVQPFADATTDDLEGNFAEQDPEVLRSDPLHVVRLVHTHSAGLVGVHAARTTQGLVVISVIGEPHVAPPSLHTAVLEVGDLVLGRPSAAHYANLFDADLIVSDFVEVTERQVIDEGPAQQEQYEAILPAWEVASTHDLTEAPGVPTALAALRGWLQEPDAPSAVQSARSKFTKTTFEAAAVTAFGYRASNMPSLAPVTRRYATLRFNRPYAVLALTDTQGVDPSNPSRSATIATDEWRGVPAFAAWIEHVTP